MVALFAISAVVVVEAQQPGRRGGGFGQINVYTAVLNNKDLQEDLKVTDAQNALTISYKLSRGALSTTGEAVDFLTTAINAYGLNQKQTTQTADMFAQAVADGKVKLSEISETFAQVASVA